MGACTMRFSVLLPALIFFGCGATWAQSPAYGVGKTPTPEEIRAEDITISPDGKNLPPGKGTAKEGVVIYAQKCAMCHDHPAGRIPARETIASLPLDTVVNAMTTGVMQTQAAGMSPDEIRAVAYFVTGKTPSTAGQVNLGPAPAAPQAAQALTGGQQTAANNALCSAIGSHIPNPASAGPSALSDPAVMSTAASSFAGSTKLPISSATDLLKGYVSQHATDILASCAASNATSGLSSKLPGAGSLTSIPKLP